MEILNQLWADYSPMVISFAIAIAILLVFYIGACIARAVIRRVMHKTELDNRFMQTFGLKEDFPIENVAAGGAFWLIMVYGLLTFLDKLDLETVAQPINRFLTEIFAYLPKLGAALGLMVLAWVIASLVKISIAKLAETFSVDDRLNQLEADSVAEGETQQEFTIGESLSTAGYWFIFLMFLPLILGTLGMQSLVEPLQDMFSKVFTYLPNIVSAAIVFIIGNFVARIVRKVVSSLLAATGVDSFSERVGLTTTISSLVGTLSFTVILLLVIVQALDALQIEAVSAPARDMIGMMFLAVPGLISAGLVIGISWFVGKLVAGLVTDLLEAAGFNSVTEKVGFGSELKRSPSEYVGSLVLLGIILFAILGATELIGFEPLGLIVTNLIDFAFRVILGAVVLGLGIMIANKVHEVVMALNPAAANLARIAILVLTGAMALRQIGVADDIISLAFGITLGAIGIGAALAIGLGSKDIAGREVEGFINKMRG